MRAPSVPRMVVELGRAIEVDGTEWIWTWNTRDNWVVASSVSGNRLYLFKKPGETVDNPKSDLFKRGSKLYRAFTRHSVDKTKKGTVAVPRKQVGRAIHVVYESAKFGKTAHYIHTFDKQPIVWVDKPNLPKIMVLTGGDIRITRRGIEG